VIAADLARLPTLRDRNDPVGAEEFAQLMAAFAPFEPTPDLAVAVSGGSDSMALALLAQAWVRAEGGRVFALTVDHGLRPEASAEAAQTAAWCAAHGIAHETLVWTGPHPASGIQEAARHARYRLLEDWCRARGVLHLLVAHQRDDQAETYVMRSLRQSGSDGLAGMAAIVERGAVRVLRPLLGVSRARLQATLNAVGQCWIDDPSNRNPAYLRTQLRAARSSLEAAEDGATLAAHFGAARVESEKECARLLARSAMLHPAGFAWLDPAPLRQAPRDHGGKALAAILATIGGADYPPRRERLERLLALVIEGLSAGRTLGGCLILPRRGTILICREPAAMAPPQPVGAGVTRWDGRFDLALGAAPAREILLGGLGPDLHGLPLEATAALTMIPPAARPSLPVLRDAKGVVAIPPLGYFSGWSGQRVEAGLRMAFRPTRPLTGAGFRIV